mmetsp:Transcript_33195/g.50869  ORF Transcript_33195/g.50869 Transcript_33195/m.50869 type:complete len:104 (+) Transcript_33195:951-1262(+)
MKYRMIVIDFGEDSEHLSSAMNVEVEQREPNFISFKYKKLMSFIFLISSLSTLFIFAMKIYPMKYEHIGFIKKVVFANLVCLALYNLLYAFDATSSLIGSFLD